MNSQIEERDTYEKIGWKDILAVMIAQFQIIMPFAIAFVVIIGIVLLFMSKVWLGG